MVVVAKPGDNSFNPSRYRSFDSAPCKFSSRVLSCPSRMTHLRHCTAHQGWRSLPFQRRRRRQSLRKNVASFFQTADDSFDRSWIGFTSSLKAHWSQETPFALQNWHSFASKIPLHLLIAKRRYKSTDRSTDVSTAVRSFRLRWSNRISCGSIPVAFTI